MPISLRVNDLNFLAGEIANGQVRASSGFGNNVAHPTWGNSNQPFLRLSPAHPETSTVNGVRVTGASGSPLPNERVVSNVVSQFVGPDGLSIDIPSTAQTNLLLMSFGQFFDHGLDFYARGGGAQFVDLTTVNAQLAAIAAANPGLNIDVTDNIIAQGVPPQLQFLIGGRAGRYTVDINGVVTLDNVNGTEHLNATSPFVDQNQTYGSTAAMQFLLRETARDANGNLLRDGNGNLIKTHRLLDGSFEIGPDGVSRGNLPTYTDILLNNGVTQAELAQALAIAAAPGGDLAGFNFLEAALGFVNFGDINDGFLTPLIGDKNDFDSAPFDNFGQPNPNFSLEALLSYYVAGDHRPNENIALTAVHTVWHREHNFQADKIAALHPEWTAEQVFQAAKAITVAQYQRTVFDEFAEKMSGTLPGAGDHGFDGYTPNVNPGISDEFAGAMYRVGHSMINETIPYLDDNGVLQEVSLIDAFLNPAMFAGAAANHPEVPGGAASLMGGLVQVQHQRIDHSIVEAVRSMLLGLPLDLGAANLMRGRELGLPSLNEFRAYISGNTSFLQQNGQASDYSTEAGIPQLSPYANWDEFGAALRGTAAERADLLARFKAVYGEDVIDPGNGLINGTGISHVNDVDLWIGGLAEASFGASQMGSTFTWIFQEQLDRLQDGDRFYYINQFDGTMLLRDVDSEHFSDLIARNTGLTHLHWDTFETAETVAMTAAQVNRNFSDFNNSVVELVLVGNALNNVITGTDSNDTIYGGDGNDTLNGGGGKDALHGEGGNDVLNASLNAQDAFLYGEAGDDILNGNGNDDVLRGGDGADVLYGNDGKDFLNGDAGDDWMVGGDGADDAFDGGDGIDTIDYSASGAGVTINLTVPAGRFLPDEGEGGTADGDVAVNVENILGSAFNDVLTGDGANNAFEGGAGADALIGGAGNDTVSYRTSNAGVSIHLLLGTASGGHAQGDSLSGFENVIGSAFNDTLIATNTANIIDGGAGADAMTGGGGGDRYYVDNAGDTVGETAGGGVDIVYAMANWTLAAGAEVEQIRANYLSGPGLVLGGNELVQVMIGGVSGDDLSGGGGADVLLGMAGNDTLRGGVGALNQLQGGLGDDLYVLDVNDTVVELAGEGVDTIETVLGVRTIAANVENLTYTGAGAFIGIGNALANVITGAGGNDNLSGRGGNDSLVGGAGVDLASYAQAVAGVTLDLSLGAASNDGDGGTDGLTGIENVLGSAFADSLSGSAGANTLSGGGGDDILSGLDGADVLLGALGADTLRGGAGAANQMQGGVGNDTYVVDASDTVVEHAGEGIDTIETSLAYRVLGANVENLTYTGGGNFAGVGNALANLITGGAGADTLAGGLGNDTLNGGGGQDLAILSGLAANYVVTAVAGGFQVTDLIGGRDGVDQLIGIERVRFSNGATVLLSTLAAAPTLSAKEAGPSVLPAAKDDGTSPPVLPPVEDSGLKGIEVAQVIPAIDDFVFKTLDLPPVLPPLEAESAGPRWKTAWSDLVEDARFAAHVDQAGEWFRGDGDPRDDWFF